MYVRKLVLLVFSLLLVFFIEFFFLYQINVAGPFWGIPAIVGMIYSLYVTKMVLDEFNIYWLDKKEGTITSEMVLERYQAFGQSARDSIPAMPIAVFCDRKTGQIYSLGGDYTKIELNIGSTYRVTFLKHARVVTSIDYKKEITS
jgi:hypothetical protein